MKLEVDDIAKAPPDQLMKANVEESIPKLSLTWNQQQHLRLNISSASIVRFLVSSICIQVRSKMVGLIISPVPLWSRRQTVTFNSLRVHSIDKAWYEWKNKVLASPLMVRALWYPPMRLSWLVRGNNTVYSSAYPPDGTLSLTTMATNPWSCVHRPSVTLLHQLSTTQSIFVQTQYTVRLSLASDKSNNRYHRTTQLSDSVDTNTQPQLLGCCLMSKHSST